MLKPAKKNGFHLFLLFSQVSSNPIIYDEYIEDLFIKFNAQRDNMSQFL